MPAWSARDDSQVLFGTLNCRNEAISLAGMHKVSYRGYCSQQMTSNFYCCVEGHMMQLTLAAADSQTKHKQSTILRDVGVLKQSHATELYFIDKVTVV